LPEIIAQKKRSHNPIPVDLWDWRARGRPRLRQNVAKFDDPVPTRAADGHHLVISAVSHFANHEQLTGT
jgi:hypothetical protein